MRINEDRERQAVEIDGVEFAGFITESPCSKCGDLQIYYDAYDEYFCPTCNDWMHPSSNDSGWAQFPKPERPLPIKKKL
jgi:hypothetical protein